MGRSHRLMGAATLTVFCFSILCSCGGGQERTAIPATSTATFTKIPSVALTITPIPGTLPLSLPGPHAVGFRRMIKFIDERRNNREVVLSLWYPAIPPADTAGKQTFDDAAPDLSGAPYPLILTSTKVGFYFAQHLASYGFVVAGVNGQDSKDEWGQWLIDFPLDQLFALDKLSLNPPEGLERVIDTDHAGAMGYSFDGYDALALSGARVDPGYYLSKCEMAAFNKPSLPEWWIEYICAPVKDWEAFSAYGTRLLPPGEDGLWQAMTDERIKAVIPMAPEGAWLFGPDGLAAVDRKWVMVIGATEDDINIYNEEAVPIYEQLSTPNRLMISFIGQGHMMMGNPDQVAKMNHFIVAFFVIHLQGQDDFAGYFSDNYISQTRGLALGIYQEK